MMNVNLKNACIVISLSIATALSFTACKQQEAGLGLKSTSTESTPLPGEGDMQTGENIQDGSNVLGSSTPEEKTNETKLEHVLIFSDEDKKMGLDEKLKYTENDLQLIADADRLYQEGRYKEANEAYSSFAAKFPASERDPLFLINWGMTQAQLDLLLDAQAKFSAAVEKVDMQLQLKTDLIRAMNELIGKMPDVDGYKERKCELRRMVYELDTTNIGAGLKYVTSSLDRITEGNFQYFPLEQAKLNLDILEGINARQWKNTISSEEFSDAYLKLASCCMMTRDAEQYIDSIKNCINRASSISDEKAKNPFVLYIKGLLSQYDGDMASALKYIHEADRLEMDNRDIKLWLSAYDPEVKGQKSPTVSISPADIGADGDGFDTYAGTLWLDEGRLITTVYKNSNNATSQRLINLNLDSMKYDEVYRAREFLQVCFITPDKKNIVLNDGGLKIINIDTKAVTEVSKLGYQSSLSPDGNFIAYTENGIWIYDMTKGIRRQLDSGRDDASPIWFPDGKSLLFVGDLGGKELGDGAGHLQSIFRMSIENPLGKKKISGDWQSKFHYINWIKEGEIAHVEEGWDDGFNSVILNLSNGEKKSTGNQHEGDVLVYGSGNGGIYKFSRNGSIVRMDTYGKTLSNYQLGAIGGYRFGVSIEQCKIQTGSERLMFFYCPTLQNVTILASTDKNLENPRYIAEIQRSCMGVFIINPSQDKVLLNIENGRLMMADMQ